MAALPETLQLPVHMSVSHLKLTRQKDKVSKSSNFADRAAKTVA